jgi:prepilin-type N-terminal cleavage/methylation domain-containing protein
VRLAAGEPVPESTRWFSCFLFLVLWWRQLARFFYLALRSFFSPFSPILAYHDGTVSRDTQVPMPDQHMSRQGSTLIEVLMALTILSVGVLGLVGASATVNRMLGHGRWSSITMSVATRRMDLLRAMAQDSTSCASLAGGSGVLAGGLTERWSVVPGVRSVGVEVVVSGRMAHADTMTTVIPCM